MRWSFRMNYCKSFSRTTLINDNTVNSFFYQFLQNITNVLRKYAMEMNLITLSPVNTQSQTNL